MDGADYFNDVFEDLAKAEEQVFITDWWLCPEMFLKRPSTVYPESQILAVLKKLSDRGVQIYVHMYKEMKVALGLNSLHSKKVLKKHITKNIHIIRHPQFNIMGGTILWSHHEKIVCIDQKIAFLGGLDLCYGRWDTQGHKLTDCNAPYT